LRQANNDPLRPLGPGGARHRRQWRHWARDAAEVFLASAASDFVTGAAIAVDGGFSAMG
jgi:NAD(P)-dependent dehydrogenase (short-subunit alcohol dehydrogenase family)